MSEQVTPAKRPHEESSGKDDGRRKLQKSSSNIDVSPSIGSHSSKMLRVLCPASRLDSIIGEDGSTMCQIHHETGVRISVVEIFPGCDERIITIDGLDKENEVDGDEVKDKGNETQNPEASESPEGKGERDENKHLDKKVEASDSEKENETSLIQRALLLLFDKMVEGLLERNEADEESYHASSTVVRLLIFSTQVGRLLGKAGSVIKQMANESGAQIRILPKDKLPTCASTSDELVQISGKLDAIKKALHSVSLQLFEKNLHNPDSLSANAMGPSSRPMAPSRAEKIQPPPKKSHHGHGPASFPGFRDDGLSFSGRANFPSDILSFRLLCSEEKVGGVIGKGGNVVKALQHETGCEIKVLDGGDDSEDRIIVVSGPAHPDDGISPPQDAVLRVQARIFRSAPESKEKPLTSKLLVSSHQVGCLLGKGGSVIAEMRKTTGAYIRILAKDQAPKHASEDEEVVQINGEFEVIQEALIQITSRLRNNFFRDAFPHLPPPPNPAFMEQMPPYPPYMGRREFSPPGMLLNRGPPFSPFDGPGGFHPHNDHPRFAHDFPGPGMPPHLSERAPWGPRGPLEGPGPMGYPDYLGPAPRRFSGFVGQLPIITSTTVEVVVPRFVVPALYGEGGGCLRQIQEFSDARITITDPKHGANETLIIISGTPEQTFAAQSLIQAFVISETEAR